MPIPPYPNIPLHSHVRSFDFAQGPRKDGQPCDLWAAADGRDIEGDRACYVEGVVCAIIPAGERFDTPDPGGFIYPESCDRYAIRVTRKVFSGKVTDDRQTWACPPVNGTPTSLGRVMNSVEVV